MNFIISANTDVGLTKNTNQDSLSVMALDTPRGKMAFGILCDGMGGLEQGELASSSVVNAFRRWVKTQLPALCAGRFDEQAIRNQWDQLIQQQNEAIKGYGLRNGFQSGTTAVIMLLTQTNYYIMNVGDSRAYEITSQLRQITADQTLVAREVAEGRLTEEAARCDPRRNILLQCIGASEQVYPQMYTGECKTNAVYMLCSDGFRHELTPNEIFAKLQPGMLFDADMMHNSCHELIEWNKQRRERDNISVALIRTF